MAKVTQERERVQVRMLRNVRVSEEGYHDGYAKAGQLVNVSPVVAQDWAYCGVCEYVNPADQTDYQPDRDLRMANHTATPNMQAELDALKAQVAALLAAQKAK